MFPAVARTGLRAAARQQPRVALQQQHNIVARRSYASDREGRQSGKSKLTFRFGLKDVPVELYPMFVVVIAACSGGAFAVGRHFYKDGDLRLVPTGMKKKVNDDAHGQTTNA